MASRDCLGQLDRLVRRVHLVPQEPTGSPEHLEPEAHRALMVQLGLPDLLERQDPEDPRVRRANADPLVKWDSLDHQDPRASPWAMMLPLCPHCWVKAPRRVRIL